MSHRPPIPAADPAPVRDPSTRGGRPRGLFIVPGHQTGPDGITDYTFWLAAAAGRAGVDCLVYAFHPFDDRSEGYADRFPAGGPARLVVRQSGSGPLARRLAELEHAKREFAPDWISLQFTPGIFREDRFFLPGLRRLARVLGRTTPVFLTVHETARVLISDRTWRERALGRLRRFEIAAGLRGLRPAAVFTSNPRHREDLVRDGFSPVTLPVISNIPRRRPPPPLDDTGLPPDARIALLFARIPADWNPAPVLAALRRETTGSGRPLAIVSVGETGHRDLGWQAVARTAGNLGLACRRVGPMPPDVVSAWLQRAEWGLCPTPFSLWQKSSSCAAMIDHGLPVIFADPPSDPAQAWPARFAHVDRDALRWVDAPAERRAPATSADLLWNTMAPRLPSLANFNPVSAIP